jgi:hypothetical protein
MYITDIIDQAKRPTQDAREHKMGRRWGTKRQKPGEFIVGSKVYILFNEHNIEHLT